MQNVLGENVLIEPSYDDPLLLRLKKVTKILYLCFKNQKTKRLSWMEAIAQEIYLRSFDVNKSY